MAIPAEPLTSLCCGHAGEREDFAERYLQAMLPKHADASMHIHARNEMASPVTPVNGSAFAVVHQAIQETLAHGRVRPYAKRCPTRGLAYKGTVLHWFQALPRC